MIKLKKEFTFDAAHRLCYHQGECANLHGHTYKLIVTFICNDRHYVFSEKDYLSKQPDANMLLDFSIINKIVKDILNNKYDHKLLNETMMTDMPTAELIAHNLYLEIQSLVKHMYINNNVKLYEVEVYETPTSSAVYNEISI
jgi:6-pyruvoyltetrahydropterin/6-carboxytetrahydropterin synthase